MKANKFQTVLQLLLSKRKHCISQGRLPWPRVTATRLRSEVWTLKSPNEEQQCQQLNCDVQSAGPSAVCRPLVSSRQSWAAVHWLLLSRWRAVRLVPCNECLSGSDPSCSIRDNSLRNWPFALERWSVAVDCLYCCLLGETFVAHFLAAKRKKSQLLKPHCGVCVCVCVLGSGGRGGCEFVWIFPFYLLKHSNDFHLERSL